MAGRLLLIKLKVYGSLLIRRVLFAV